MRCILILYSILCFSSVHCQTDTTKRFLLGGQFDWGVAQQDFSSLHKYQYLLNSPQKIAFNAILPSVSLFLGNPNKLFLSLDVSVKMGMPKKGAYENYNIQTTSLNNSLGVGATLPLPSVMGRKMRGFYVSMGVHQLSTSITSKATGQSISLQDTSFNYESSHARIPALRLGLVVEFARKGNHVPWEQPHFIVNFGYNVQLGQPQWSGTFTRNPNDGSSPVNLGGFTLGVGLNFWLKKGALRISPKTDTSWNAERMKIAMNAGTSRLRATG